MSGKVSDLPIRSKRALVRPKQLDRINFKSGKRGRVLRNPPGVTTGQWVSRVVGNVHGHVILCHMMYACAAGFSATTWYRCKEIAAFT